MAILQFEQRQEVLELFSEEMSESAVRQIESLLNPIISEDEIV